jgi:hypothetical protein
MSENVENLIERTKAKLEKLPEDYSLISGPELKLNYSHWKVVLGIAGFSISMLWLLFLGSLPSDKPFEQVFIARIICFSLSAFFVYGIYGEIKKLKRKTPEFIISEEGLIYEDKNFPWSEIEGDKFEQSKSGYWFAFTHKKKEYNIDLNEFTARIKEIKFAYYSYKLRYLQRAQNLQDDTILSLSK